MRARVERGALLELLAKVKSAVPSRTSLPVCSSILLKAGQGKLTATANNLDAALTGNCEAAVAKGGAVCTQPRSLESFLKAVDADNVALATTGKDTLKVEASQISTTIRGFEAQDFPPNPLLNGRAKASEITGLRQALDEVDYAMANDDTRPVLNSICLRPVNGKIELAASDGLRLAVTALKVKGTLPEVVIPSTAVKLLKRLMPEKVTARVYERKLKPVREGEQPEVRRTVAFEANGLTLMVNPIESSYPEYTHIIPKNGAMLKADAGELRKALKVVSAVKVETNVLRLQTKGKALTLSVEDGDKGRTEARVASHGRVKIAFNKSYFRDLLERLEGQMVLRTNGPQAPVVAKQNGTIHVLMPMFVQW